MRTKPENGYPKINVAKLIQRASDLATACCRDKKELVKQGLDWNKAKIIGGLISTCSEKEAEYQLQKEKKADETARLLDYVKSCGMVYKEAVKSANRALCAVGTGIKAPGIRGARSRAELVQDLSDIAVFCRMHNKDLKKARFDFRLAEKAKRTAKELSEALAEAQLRKRTPSKLVEERNRICSELYETGMEVCRIGRQAFKHDCLRKRDYCSMQYQ
jgi:hypothetical protein